ncbi:Crp/Fnr family transcriptional regulator [Amycolatopsis oliviviridis]|uniref:Cyclic AMP receptor protein n=1 Tax=Amycolatopsis oliviviridis TaxID=1471590 RepID=A0ABQ3L989_9PSEU|nr:Crp/Fnr family transcriptional regulator [Amycolatopsis oliviviridis]GHH09332.1 cyclic AMP receptor protein [Amycolatopsis oliviviridis]
MDDLGALAAVPLFAGLDRERLQRVAARSSVRVFEAGHVVAVRGDPATRLIVVESGTLTAVHDTVDGRRLRLGQFAAPCAVDKVAVLDTGDHTATWSAATRARLRFVPARELSALIDDLPGVRRHVLAYLVRDLRDLRDELVRANFADVTTRVAAWLARAAGRSGTTVLPPGAQQGLAEAIGATRVSVNRALRALAAEGLISVGPGSVEVLAPELLARRAGV